MGRWQDCRAVGGKEVWDANLLCHRWGGDLQGAHGGAGFLQGADARDRLNPEALDAGGVEAALDGADRDRHDEESERVEIKSGLTKGDTLLTGPVVDQAALHGLIKKVRDLGMPLVSVSQVQFNQTLPYRSKGDKQ